MRNVYNLSIVRLYYGYNTHVVRQIRFKIITVGDLLAVHYEYHDIANFDNVDKINVIQIVILQKSERK